MTPLRPMEAKEIPSMIGKENERQVQLRAEWWFRMNQAVLSEEKEVAEKMQKNLNQ